MSPTSTRTSRVRPPIAAAVAILLGIAGIGYGAVGAASAAPVSGGVVINEIESNGDASDWIELTNTSDVAVDVSGWIMKDNDPARTDALPSGTVIEPGAFVVFTAPEMSFGLGKEDAARLYLPDGESLVDEYSWTQHAVTTFGRCPGGTGSFVTTAAATPGAANDCTTPTSPAPPPTTSPTTDPASGALVVNEVESNGDDTDWFELFNLGDAPLDVTGYIVRDNDDAKAYALPAGSVVPARGILLVDQLTAHSPGFDFGLGNADMVRVFSPDGGTLVASYAWTVHAATSYGRCPDGTGEMRETTVTTKGAPNNCALPVKINEVESSGGTPGDWIELVNLSDTAVEAEGLVVTDSDVSGHRYVLPSGTTIPARGYLVLDESAFGFGLGGEDAVHLFDTDGVTPLDETSWTAHAPTTWGRCSDGTGPFTVTAESTRAAANRCAGEVVVSPWPGGASVRVLDEEATFTGDLSGLDEVDGVLWGVENGNGLLYRLLSQGDRWLPAPGWESGKKLRYPGGGGTVDAEGVVAVGDDVYVSSERNNDASSVSRPAVLRVDPTASGTELTADAEWNLAADFPGLGANAGLEGITWIPDSWLVARGFVDERTGRAYAPGDYRGHGQGVFFVGVEGTAAAYAYALMDDGSFARIATIDTDFALVAELEFDRDRLWVVCDEACDGRSATYEIDETGAFAPRAVYARPAEAANVANEGFAIASACVDGVAATFYADDADTDGFSLRGGTLSCADGGTGPTPEPSPTPSPSATPDPSATPGPTPTPEPSETAGPTQVPEPSATSGPARVAPDPSELTGTNRGTIQAPSTVRAGSSFRVRLDPALAGETVAVWLFSAPTDLGAAVVGSGGAITVWIPVTVPAGEHRLVITEPTGAVLAWTELTVTGDGLAATGGSSGGSALAVVGGVIALLAGLALLRRRTRTAG